MHTDAHGWLWACGLCEGVCLVAMAERMVGFELPLSPLPPNVRGRPPAPSCC